jgi:hypothetical protein
MPSPAGVTDDAGDILDVRMDINEFMASSTRAVQISQWTFLGGLGLAAASLLYCFALWAIRFIGPRERHADPPDKPEAT